MSDKNNTTLKINHDAEVKKNFEHSANMIAEALEELLDTTHNNLDRSIETLNEGFQKGDWDDVIMSSYNIIDHARGHVELDNFHKNKKKYEEISTKKSKQLEQKI